MLEQNIREILPAKLRELRIKANLTVAEVGEKLGKSLKTVSGWEHGRGQPDADMLFRLCELYNVSSFSELYDQPRDYSEETELVSIYRSLNDNGRNTLMQTARAFAGTPSMQKEPSHAATA